MGSSVAKRGIRLANYIAINTPTLTEDNIVAPHCSAPLFVNPHLSSSIVMADTIKHSPGGTTEASYIIKWSWRSERNRLSQDKAGSTKHDDMKELHNASDRKDLDDKN